VSRLRKGGGMPLLPLHTSMALTGKIFTTLFPSLQYSTYAVYKGKGKAIPLQAWSDPECSRKLRFPDFMTTAQDGCKVSLTHRPPLPPGNTPGTHFC